MKVRAHTVYKILQYIHTQETEGQKTVEIEDIRTFIAEEEPEIFESWSYDERNAGNPKIESDEDY